MIKDLDRKPISVRPRGVELAPRVRLGDVGDRRIPSLRRPRSLLLTSPLPSTTLISSHVRVTTVVVVVAVIADGGPLQDTRRTVGDRDEGVGGWGRVGFGDRY